MANKFLATLVGGQHEQYANVAGQFYYYDTIGKSTSYSIPAGYEDHAQDVWRPDNTKQWPQWINSRTGRAITIDPHPVLTDTYLDDNGIKADIDLIVKVPESDEHLYRRPMKGILEYMFPRIEGFSVFQESTGDTSSSDFAVFKVFRTLGGSFYQYDFLLGESKPIGEPWGSTEDQLWNQLSGNGNESKNCYGLIQIGVTMQFYKYMGQRPEKVGGRLHLVNDAKDIVRWGQYLKDNPLSVV